MFNWVEDRAQALGKWLWLGPAFSLGLYAGRLLSEQLRPGLAGAAFLTLAAIAVAVLVLRHKTVWNTWPLLLLLIYVFYPEPDPRIAAAAGLAALFGLLLTADLSRLSSRLSKRTIDILLISLLGLCFLTLYVNTLAPDLLPADGGELQLIAAKLGVAHPTGFPLYTMLANLATRLPIGPNEAYRVNLFSALTSTATLILVFLAVYRLSGSRLAGLLAASILGTSTTFWSQATTANVRSLTALFTAAALYLLLLLRDRQTNFSRQGETLPAPSAEPSDSGASRGRTGILLQILFVMVLVLAVTHHSSLIFIGSIFGMYAIIVQPEFVRRPTRWPVLLLAALIALLPLLYLPLRGAAGASGAPDDIATPAGFLNHVLGLGFRGDLLFFDDMAVLWARLIVMVNVLTFQFSSFVLLTMLAGLILLFRRDKLLAVVLAASLAIHTLVAAIYRAPQTVEYMLPVYVLLATLFGYAGSYLRGFASPAAASGSRNKLRGVVSVSLLVAMIMAALAQATANYRSYRWLSQDTTAREYAQPLLQDAPAGSLILADWHWATPLWYLQQVEDQRRDVEIQFVFPEVGPYARTWARRIAGELASGRTVISTHFEPGAFAGLPLAEPLHEAFLFRQRPRTGLAGDYVLINEELGPDIWTEGYHLESQSVQPGHELVVEVAWLSAELDPGRTFFAHLIGQDGQLYAGEDQPARSQEEGLTINQFRLAPRLDATPGVYELVVGSYTGADPAAEYRTTLTQITVEAAETPTFTQNRAYRPLSYGADDRTLVGYDWDSTLPGRQRLHLHWSTASGYETQSEDVDGGQFTLPAWIGPWGLERNHSSFTLDRPAAYVPFGEGLVWLGQSAGGLDPVAPGQRVSLPQDFTTSRPLLSDLVVSLRLVGYQEDGQKWHWWDLDDGVPAMGAIPTLKWIAGSQVRDPVQSTVSSDAWTGQEMEPLLLLYDAFTARQLPILDERYTQLAPWLPLGRSSVTP